MSSEERTPENNKNIEGNEDQAVQGDHNQVIQGINNFFIGFFHIFSFTTPSHSSSRRKLTKRQKWIMGGCGSVALLTVAGFTVPGIIDILQPKDASLEISLEEEILLDVSGCPNPSLGEKIIIDVSDCQGISLGEEILIEPNIQIKQKLEKAFSDKDYQQFKNLLGNYLKQNPNSPELWVYWNNAKAALLSNNNNPIKIAVSIPSETNPNVANEILGGVALAQNEINDLNNETGINGQLLQVVIANDKNDDKLAKKVAESFTQDPSILAVVGHNASNASLAAKDIYKNNKLVMITPTSLSDQLQSDSYIFRMVPVAYSLGNYVKKEYPNSNIGICADPDTADNNSAFLTQFYVLFDNKYINLSCDFLDDPGLTDDAEDKKIATILKEIKDNKINSLVLAPYIERISEFTNILQIVRNKNSGIRLYGSPTFLTRETFQGGQEVVEGLTLSVPWYADDNKPKNFQFRQEFKQLYQAPSDNWRTAMAYDATWIIATGLERISKKQQQSEREQLNNVLQKKSHDGAIGKSSFDDQGLNVNPSADYVIQIKDGEFTPLRF